MKVYIKLVGISHDEFKNYIDSFSKEYNCDVNVLKDTYWCIASEKACKRLIELQNELKQLKKQIIVTIGGLW